MGSKVKYSWQLSRSEAADLLRKLAHSIEQGEEEVSDYGIQLAELSKYKIKIALGIDNSLELKFTGKFGKTEGTAEFAGTESYSSLKKRMQTYFKAMRDSLARGEFPSREIVTVFLADSITMTTYSGYGDEFYAEYTASCVRLQKAFEAEDAAFMGQVLTELGQAKKRCHEIYK